MPKPGRKHSGNVTLAIRIQHDSAKQIVVESVKRGVSQGRVIELAMEALKSQQKQEPFTTGLRK